MDDDHIGKLVLLENGRKRTVDEIACTLSPQKISSNDSLSQPVPRHKHAQNLYRPPNRNRGKAEAKVRQLNIQRMKLVTFAAVAAFVGVTFAQHDHDHDHGGDSEECEEALESFIEFLEENERRRILSDDHDHDHEHHIEEAVCDEAAGTFMIEEEGGETFEGNLTDYEHDGCPTETKCERLICEDGELLIAHFEACCGDVALDAEPALECEVEHDHAPSKAISHSSNLGLVAALCLLKLSGWGQ